MRASGILLPISSLPGKYGIGSFSKEAYKFVDFLKNSNQKYWQILPIGPTSYGDSPYQSFSTYAGNPYFISLEDLIDQGLLTEEECKKVKFGNRADTVDYEKLYNGRFKLLKKAYKKSNIGEKEEFKKFKDENCYWLNDYAMFMAIKERFEGRSFDNWAEDIKLRWEYSMEYYKKELSEEIEFYEFVLHDPGLFQGDLPEHCNFDGAFRCVFVWCRSSGSVCSLHVPGKRCDHGIGDSILWYCSERTVSDYLSGDLRRSRGLRKKSGDS